MGGPRFDAADYIGKTFGQWTVIGPGQKKYHVRARCSCGTEREIIGAQLRAGLRKRCQFCKLPKHGDCQSSRRSRLYQGWCSRKQQKQEMPEPWASSYSTFREAVFALGGDANSHIRRIDLDLPFQPGNIYIYDATVARQERLGRISQALTILGNPRTVEQLANVTRERRYQLLMGAIRLPGEKRYVPRRTASLEVTGVTNDAS